MITEIVIGVVSSLIATVLIAWYNKCKKSSAQKSLLVKELMKKLVDVKASNTRSEQQKILLDINKKLGKNLIRKDYIEKFVLNNRRLEDVFLDICVQNDIEPTSDICAKFLGFRLFHSTLEYISYICTRNPQGVQRHIAQLFSRIATSERINEQTLNPRSMRL